ncbi:hypothetical protein Pmar_PMAR029628 [Perkinsus marinus ATCC 50983]|uniref:Uncharacterized protein n=1 Tax=Perkinsus marinus (strain ATCC 50983 / TXsc) TaxID=423536 RepID=C5KX03_PERM5|nr:hypothetical protein Pmar_PMAR029628 [Perkinsus marinus ATCC 50983]EER11007.1 hypothetical protein Pmar_PMAR029628 [Perkinsus marinus ATCC 50983]|eukprot:XP_002779212.1 hypothetical protein Pmar_PMAR029628 [Perkinsus marinus ATCC 50983]
MSDAIVDAASAMQSKNTAIDIPFKFSDKAEARAEYRNRLLAEHNSDGTSLALIKRDEAVFANADEEFNGEIAAEILELPSGTRVLDLHSQLQKISDDFNDLVDNLLDEREKVTVIISSSFG